MLMFSLFFKKNKPHLSLILDIQSALVRASLVEVISKDKKPLIRWTQHIDIPYHADGDSSGLVSATISSISACVSGAQQYLAQQKDVTSKNIQTVHCVMSSPWIVSEAQTVREQFPKQTVIRRAYIKSVVERARTTMLQGRTESMKGIEEKIFDVRLNGYSIEKWDRNKTDHIEVSFALSMMSVDMVQKIETAIADAHIKARVDFHSSLLLQHIALKQCSPMQAPRMVVHTHGELTDVVVAYEQSCILFASFPIGVTTINRALVAEGLSESEADSALSLYESDQIDAIHGSREVTAVTKVLEPWIHQIQTIYKATPISYMPDRAIVSSRTHEQLFVKTIKKAFGFSVIDVLPHEELFAYVDFDPSVERMRLTILYVVAIHTLEYL